MYWLYIKIKKKKKNKKIKEYYFIVEKIKSVSEVKKSIKEYYFNVK